jgi:TPR repeat protein
MRPMKTLFFSLIFSFTVNAVAASHDQQISELFDKAVAEAEAGKTVSALEKFVALGLQGYVSAQINAGTLHDSLGEYEDAHYWFSEALKNGEATAGYQLGVYYRKGRWVEADNTQAAVLFRLAAEAGDAAAQNNLAILYSLGEGVIRDPVLAHMWANISAAQGNKKSSKLMSLEETTMSQTLIEEAYRLARACVKNNLKGC